jgi:DNA repair photolyase
MTREEFHKQAVPRLGILATLEKDAQKFKGKEIFLSFSCDPYPQDDDQMMARQAIKIIHNAGATVRILTKGGKRAERDFDLLGKGDAFGVTLTSSTEQKLEPKAGFHFERRASLLNAHEKGIYTWVSLEPVINPEQSLDLIKFTNYYVDEYKIGTWNYDDRAKKINWKDFGLRAIEICEKYGKKYYIKNDLKKYIEEGGEQ